MGNARPPRHPGRSRLVLGLSLLLIGAGLLVLKSDISMPWELWSYFPVPLIALGVWGMINPSRHLDRIAGLWLLASGVYCLIGVFDLFDLGWSGAWPIFIIAAGVSVMLQSDRFLCPNMDRRSRDDQ